MWKAVVVVVLAVACSGEKKVAPPKAMTLSHAPKCEAGAMLQRPIAVYAESGSMKFYGAHTGTTGETTVQVRGDVKEVTLKFGICANPPSTGAYVCAAHNHDDVRYYAERKVTVDPATDNYRGEFAESPSPTLCTDGKPATF